jgi:ABC-type amino acid transport substrate-binding protein
VTASPAVRRTLSAPQYLLVVLLAVWALAEVGASFVQLADPLSRFGFSLREGSLVLSVEPGSPADLAGVRPGQRLLLDRMDSETRSRIVHGAERTPATVTVPVEQDGRVRFVRMTSAPVPVSTQEWIEVGAAALVALTFIATGVALVALRPTRATWSFLLLATGYPIVQLGALRTIVPVDLLDFDAAALGVALAMTVWGAVSFTTSFPDLLPDALTRRYARILYAAASVLGVLFFVTYAGFTGPSRYTVFQIYEAVLIGTRRSARGAAGYSPGRSRASAASCSTWDCACCTCPVSVDRCSTSCWPSRPLRYRSASPTPS